MGTCKWKRERERQGNSMRERGDCIPFWVSSPSYLCGHLVARSFPFPISANEHFVSHAPLTPLPYTCTLFACFSWPLVNACVFLCSLFYRAVFLSLLRLSLCAAHRFPCSRLQRALSTSYHSPLSHLPLPLLFALVSPLRRIA